MSCTSRSKRASAASLDLLGGEELDRGRPPQHRVTGAVDRAHAPFAQLLLERVLAEVAGLLDLLAQAVDHVRDERGHDDSARDPQPRPEAVVPGDDRVETRLERQPQDGRRGGNGRQHAHPGGSGGRARHHHRPQDDHVGEDQDQRVRHFAGERGRHHEGLGGEADEDERDRGGVDRLQEACRQRGPAPAELPRGQAHDERRAVEEGRGRVAVVRAGEDGHDEERARDREGDPVEERHPFLQERATALRVEVEGRGAAASYDPEGCRHGPSMPHPTPGGTRPIGVRPAGPGPPTPAVARARRADSVARRRPAPGGRALPGPPPGAGGTPRGRGSPGRSC